MSPKSTFLALKKVVPVVQIGGRGGGNLDKIQKKSNFFFVKPNIIFKTRRKRFTKMTAGREKGPVELGKYLIHGTRAEN